MNLVKGDQRTDSECKTMPGNKFGHHLHYPYSPKANIIMIMMMMIKMIIHGDSNNNEDNKSVGK